MNDNNLERINTLVQSLTQEKRHDLLFQLKSSKNEFLIKLFALLGIANTEKDIASLLYTSIRTQNCELVQFLLDIPVVEDINFNNSSLLTIAALEGTIDIVKLLVKYGIDLNNPDSNFPLINLVSNKNKFPILKYLIDAGMKCSSSSANRALVEASSNGYTETVKLLVEAGADVRYSNNEPIRVAAKNGHIETCNVLLELFLKKSKEST